MGEPSLTVGNAVILLRRGSVQTLVRSSGQGLCWRCCMLCRSLGNDILDSSGCWQAIPSSMDVHVAKIVIRVVAKCHRSGSLQPFEDYRRVK